MKRPSHLINSQDINKEGYDEKGLRHSTGYWKIGNLSNLMQNEKILISA